MKDVFSLAVFESRGSVRHDPLPLCISDLRTKVGFGTLTKDTSRFTALRSITRNDVIADFYAGNSLADRLDDASSFMSKNARK
mmetsp:Transcript_31442/g.65979  ORF Transcript_31442/g.65979 Transcript_31442/m.65979 type:complete len:83 (-) Transcript_31442:286-534(-)